VHSEYGTLKKLSYCSHPTEGKVLTYGKTTTRKPAHKLSLSLKITPVLLSTSDREGVVGDKPGQDCWDFPAKVSI